MYGLWQMQIWQLDYELGEIIFLFGIPFFQIYIEEINILALYNFSVWNWASSVIPNGARVKLFLKRTFLFL